MQRLVTIISGQQGVVGAEQSAINSLTGIGNTNNINSAAQLGPKIDGVVINSGLRLPTVFDALRIAGGVTPFSKLSGYPSPANDLAAMVAAKCEPNLISLN